MLYNQRLFFFPNSSCTPSQEEHNMLYLYQGGDNISDFGEEFMVWVTKSKFLSLSLSLRIRDVVRVHVVVWQSDRNATVTRRLEYVPIILPVPWATPHSVIATLNILQLILSEFQKWMIIFYLT